MTTDFDCQANDLQSLCDLAQQQLQRMQYLQCEQTLIRAEAIALERADFDTLARLYMPLQESRRQRRLICGEGVVRLDLLAEGPHDVLDPERMLSTYPKGQLLIAGWGTIEPAVRFRQLQSERPTYVETYLAAVYSMGAGRAVVIVPTADVTLPDPAAVASIDELLRRLPAHSLVLNESQLPRGQRRGDSDTFAQTMSLWERLHAPFLAAAETEADPMRKLRAYRRTIDVDYACELAHQKLSDVSRHLARQRRGS